MTSRGLSLRLLKWDWLDLGVKVVFSVFLLVGNVEWMIFRWLDLTQRLNLEHVGWTSLTDLNMKGHGDEVYSYSNILRHPTWLAQTSGGCKSREFLRCVHIALADAGASYSSVVRVLVNEHFQRIMDKCSLHAFQSLNLWDCLSLFWNNLELGIFWYPKFLDSDFLGSRSQKLSSLQSCTVFWCLF